MSNGKKKFIDTLMTKEDLRIGTDRILRELKKLNRILKDQHKRYHKSYSYDCPYMENNTHPVFA